MSSEIEEAYVLLTLAADEKYRRVLTRDFGVPGLTAVLDGAGMKRLRATRRPHETADADLRSRGVHLRPQNQEHGDIDHIDLVCVDPSLDLVFDHMVADVSRRVTDKGMSPVEACRSALDDWRSLLRQSSSLSEAQIVGLHGELEVLRVMGTWGDPRAALDRWKGPLKSIHDFVNGSSLLEVKGTATREGATVAIHGLDQLDSAEHEVLHLVVAHCRPGDRGLSLDDRIRELLASGFPRTELIERVGAAGYLFEKGLPSEARYDLLGLRVFKIESGFPGLRRRDIPKHHLAGISSVQFLVHLEAAREFELTDDTIESLWRAWT
ncbi:hypothetical protein BJF86_09570 [Serinicoccus sp. CNJ-927]|uniref:PD-(D/E)XK motif protein n=1 Tax=Serinicoccus sp. CNJ-927 TaxID=1904970 RepID=UPI000969D898|nr:PD-(D/E)XK motif protein [Serinicoccus sp. CNJ-927]OLT39251.1 hypothetical protein BJF86_09570 [Serinicoccus sp. CNJ-927]